MGILDLPSTALSQVDHWLTGLLPPIARLLFWAAIGAVVSMELYRLASPQDRIAELKTALVGARRRVADFDGPFEDAWPHIGGMLSLALRRVLLVLPATLVASLPLLVVVVWLDTHYGGAFPPPGEPVAVTVPGGFRAHWVEGGDPPRRAAIVDASGSAVAEVPVPAPISTIHKRRWWNALIGNPAGYLPDEAPIERIDLALPRQQFLGVGPTWIRGWEAMFFFSVLVFALAIKTVRRIA